jgi:nucleoside-diphosphate-sugar epimerase
METIKVNTSDLARLVATNLKSKGRLLFLSTSEVYSGNPRSLYREEDIGATNPAHVRSPYIESKRCGEAICHAALAAGCTALIARVSSVYGPGVRAGDTRVMSQFIDAAIKRGEIELKDGGQARRVFLYVSDAVEMLLNILLQGAGSVYNVGGQASLTGRNGVTWNNTVGEVSILALAKKIGKITDAVVSESGYKGARGGSALPGAPAHTGLDMSRYCREFPKEDWVSLDDGLRRTIEWHRHMAGAKAMVAA